MKIKKEMIANELADKFILLPADGEGPMIKISESGKIIWDAISKGCERDEIVDIIISKYDIYAQRAQEDVDAFLQDLIQAGLVE